MEGSDKWKNNELTALNVELRALFDIPNGSEIYIENKNYPKEIKSIKEKPDIIKYIEDLFDTTISSYSEESLIFNDENISLILQSILDIPINEYKNSTNNPSCLIIKYLENIRDMKIEYLKRNPKIQHMIQGIIVYSQISGKEYKLLSKHMIHSIMEHYNIIPNNRLTPLTRENILSLNKLTLAIAEYGLSEEDKISNKNGNLIIDKLKEFMNYGKFSRIEIIMTYYVIIQKHIFDNNYAKDIENIIQQFNDIDNGSLPKITDSSWGI